MKQRNNDPFKKLQKQQQADQPISEESRVVHSDEINPDDG